MIGTIGMEASPVRSGPFTRVGRHVRSSRLNIWSFLIGQDYTDENKEQKIYNPKNKKSQHWLLSASCPDHLKSTGLSPSVSTNSC